MKYFTKKGALSKNTEKPYYPPVIKPPQPKPKDNKKTLPNGPTK